MSLFQLNYVWGSWVNKAWVGRMTTTSKFAAWSPHRDGQAEASQSRNLPNRAGGGVGKAKGARPLVSLALGGSSSPSPSLSKKIWSLFVSRRRERGRLRLVVKVHLTACLLKSKLRLVICVASELSTEHAAKTKCLVDLQQTRQILTPTLMHVHVPLEL